jgi:type II secretory pathway component PulM
MELFGLGKKSKEGNDQNAKPKGQLNLKEIKRKVQKWLQLVSRYQNTIIALTVALLLALTALRMLRYMDPPVNDAQVQKNLNQFKQVRIDQKTVQKIKQLQGTGATASPKLGNGRTNPFSE